MIKCTYLLLITEMWWQQSLKFTLVCCSQNELVMSYDAIKHISYWNEFAFPGKIKTNYGDTKLSQQTVETESNLSPQFLINTVMIYHSSRSGLF